jgi:hypothetical protein
LRNVFQPQLPRAIFSTCNFYKDYLATDCSVSLIAALKPEENVNHTSIPRLFYFHQAYCEIKCAFLQNYIHLYDIRLPVVCGYGEKFAKGTVAPV